MITNKTSIFSKNVYKYVGEKLCADNESYLQQYYDLVNQYGYKLKFTNGLTRNLTEKSLNANAGFVKNNPIIATSEWLYQLIINKEAADIAFKGTLGHEISHKKGNIKGIRKFDLWVNEIHCDYYGAMLMLNSDRNLLLQAINYKIEFGHKNINKPDYVHPSWKHRLEYVSKYDYGEELIKRIANDTKYKNEKHIQKVIKEFHPITLK